MKRYLSFLLFVLLIANPITAQEEVSITSDDLQLYGTLLNPDNKASTVVLIIAGSGQTDRDGNTLSVNYINNSLKMVAESLAGEGIASLRYDKRGVGKSINDSIRAEKLRFDHYVNDAVEWVRYLKKKFDNVIIAGHSEGGLIALLAAQQEKPNKIITLSGMADSGYNTLKRQLGRQPVLIRDTAYAILDKLKVGEKVDSVPVYLQSLFHPLNQPFIMSWMHPNPQEEIKKIKVPILVLQGTTDIQIPVDEAKAMAEGKGKKHVELVIIEGMNHILKPAESDFNKNLETYKIPDLALHEEFMPAILDFIRKK